MGGREKVLAAAKAALDKKEYAWAAKLVNQLYLINNQDKEAREFMKHMNGTITVVKDGHYVGSIDIRTDKPVKPATGVKIKKFQTTLTFGPAAKDGPIVPLSVDVEVSGRAMLVIRFDEKESARYHEYEYVAP